MVDWAEVGNDALNSAMQDIVKVLFQEYDCVDYVTLTGSEETDGAECYHSSLAWEEMFPEWGKEPLFGRKLEFLAKHFVYALDRERFCRESCREVVFEVLKKQSSYVVQFRGQYGGEIQYYQMKFYSLQADSRPTGWVMGLRNVDAEVRAGLEQEAELNRQIRNFGLLHGIMGSGMWFIDYTERGKVQKVTWSETFRHMLGYTNERDFPNTFASLEAILHPSDHAACYEEFAHVSANRGGKSIYDIECRLRTKDRGWRWFRLAGDISRREDGTPMQLLGVFLDITDKKAREELAAENAMALELQVEFKKKLESERNDLATFQKMMGTVGWEIELNHDGRMVSVCWSDELRQLYGYQSVEDFPNEFSAFTERLHPEDSERVQDIFYAAIANPEDQKIFELDYRLQKKDGEYHWYHDIFIIHRKNEWSLPRIFGATRDTSEAHEQEAMIREKQRHDDIMNALASDFDYVCYFDVHTREVIRYRASEEFQDLLESIEGDIPSIEKLERLFKDIVVWEDYQDFWTAIQWETIFARLQTNASYLYDVRFIVRGRIKFYQIKFVRDTHSPDGLIMGFKDIDEVRKQEEQQQRVIAGLSENFECVFAVDIDTMEQRDFRVSSVFAHQIPDWTDSISFEDKMRRFAEGFVCEADRQRFIESVDLHRVLQELQRKTSYYVTFRIHIGSDLLYYQTKFIHGGLDADYLIVGFSSVDEQTRREMNEKAKLQQNLEMIDTLASEYTSVYYVNLREDTITAYTMDEMTKVEFGGLLERITYTEAMQLYTNRFVYEVDKDKVLSSCSIPHLKECLRHQKTFQMIYRSGSDIGTGFCELKFVKVDSVEEDPTAAVLVFAYKNEEIMRNYVDLKIYDNFLALYLVNLGTNSLQVVKEECLFGEEESSSFDEFSSKVRRLALRMDDAYRGDCMEISRPEVMQRYMAGLEHREFIYCLKEDPSSWERAVFYALERNEAGRVETGVLSLEKIDRSRSEELALDAKIAEQNARLEEQQLLLTEAFEQARKASEAKTTFLNNMSHDIRTPMNAIVGFNKMAQHNIDCKEKLMDCLKKVDGASEHLLMLINDVLDMARIESGKVMIDESVTDVSKHMGNVETMLSSLAEQKKVTFACHYGEIRHPMLLLDVVRVDQILINIISNAIKYTPKGGTVNYRLEELPEKSPGFASFRYTVTDNGIGMSEEFLSTIYETFSRERNSTASGVQGTGLGMAIVKKLVDFMGGTIQIESELGKGTTVVIEMEFRIADEKMLQRENEVMEASQECEDDFMGMHVLLVEDNELNREIAREIMQEIGVDVDEAVDGIDAVKKMEEAEDGQYDLVLMDIQMPVMDGYVATKKIRQLCGEYAAKVPIVAMTANVFAEDKIKAKEVGMNGHLGKPIDIPELMQTLRTYRPKKS